MSSTPNRLSFFARILGSWCITLAPPPPAHTIPQYATFWPPDAKADLTKARLRELS